MIYQVSYGRLMCRTKGASRVLSSPRGSSVLWRVGGAGTAHRERPRARQKGSSVFLQLSGISSGSSAGSMAWVAGCIAAALCVGLFGLPRLLGVALPDAARVYLEDPGWSLWMFGELVSDYDTGSNEPTGSVMNRKRAQGVAEDRACRTLTDSTALRQRRGRRKRCGSQNRRHASDGVRFSSLRMILACTPQDE